MNIYYKYTKRPTLVKGEALTNKTFKNPKILKQICGTKLS